MGDEAGYLNNYSYTDKPDQKDDSRWVHRQSTSYPEKNKNHYSRRIFDGLTELIRIRKSCRSFAGNIIQIMNLQNPHVFGFKRMNMDNPEEKVDVLANFSEEKQYIDMTNPSYDIISGTDYDIRIKLDPYQILWLKGRKS
jgi:amylosucrase